MQVSQKDLSDHFHSLPSPTGISLDYVKSIMAKAAPEELVHDLFEDHDQLCLRLSSDRARVQLVKAKADLYVSYPPNCSVQRLSQILNDLRDSTQFVWLDGESSKTNASERPEEYLDNLANVIKTIGKAIIICSPLTEPTPLTAFRSLELFLAVRSGALVRAVASKKECDDFVRELGERTIGVSGFSNALIHEIILPQSEDTPVCRMVKSNYTQVRGATTTVFESLIARLCDESTQRFGDDSEEKAGALASMASFLYVKGAKEESKRKYEEALNALAKLRGSPLEVPVLHNIAKIYEERGQFTQALELYERCRSLESPMFKLSTKLSSAEMVSPRNSLASRESWRDSFVIPSRKDDGTARTALNMACIHACRNELDKAETLMIEALELFKRNDAKSLDVAWCLNTMGVFYQEFGNTQKATENYEEAWKLRTELGAHPSLVAETALNLGCCLMEGSPEKRGERSKELLEEAYTTFMASEGRTSASTALALIELARWWSKENEDKSVELAQESIDMLQVCESPPISISDVQAEFRLQNE